MNTLKESWTIIIDNEFYRILPAFYKRSDIEKRNKWVAKFKGFNRDDNKSLIINALKSQSGKNFYWCENIEDDNLYVEFKSESDLISATNKYIYCKYIKAFRIPRNSTWP